jgi:hypothetical protein
MKRFDVKLKYKKHIWTKYNKGSFYYNFCQVDYSFTHTPVNDEIEMNIVIISENIEEGVSSVFLEILDFMYLACGTMPIIVYYRENNIDVELDNLTCRFFPSMQFFKKDHLMDIDNQTLNDKTLLALQNIVQNKPFKIFSAFTALTSKGYEKIYAEHRISLLLQCLEGYIYNKGKQYQKTGTSFKSRIEEIVNVFVEYDDKYNSEILKTFNLTKDDFLKVLTDTRHQFSHYIVKNNSLTTGTDYIIYFILLHYVFRVYIIKEIGLTPREDNIKEFFNSVYDWINDIKNEKFENFKSVAYRQKNIEREIYRILYG